LVKLNCGLNWDEIKRILVAHFANKRSEPHLLRELSQLENKRLTVELFYLEVSDVHKALCNVIDRTDTNPIAIQTKKKLYEETCLEAFVTGLKGNLGSAVRGRVPRTLLEAYEIAIKERDIYYRSKEEQ